MADYVWVLPQSGNGAVPIGARVLSRAGARFHVKDDDLVERWVHQRDILGPMHPTSVLGVDDMTSLGELQEYSILRNLQIRYRKDLIYTYVGSILVAVNPYKQLPIYGKDKMAEYRKRRLGELPPHVFAVADHSYESMRKTSEKRCIVVSGESGGGKTESTKLFLLYLATISPKQMGKERQILDSNPILEAFGNAKTVCNDNSSRFGKYISIYFNTDGSIHSAEIKHYLLEKSRIVSQNRGEENYHIFYALLNGLPDEEKQRLRLKDVSSYKYLSRGSAADENSPTPTTASPSKAPNGPRQTTSQAEEANPNRSIEVITSAMKVLNFSDLEISQIFELIAAILHLGNVQFETMVVSNVQTVKSVSEEVHSASALLQVSAEDLTDSLTKKTISTHGDAVVKLLSKQEAINSRDALAKKIFGNLFSFLVERINEKLSAGGKTTDQRIGILDIFGFEAFERNSFEQLCINYANERLQQFFIGHVFKAEQEQYASEGLSWEFVDYPDNQEVLELIESGPNSVLSVINDSTKIPRGTDQSMLDKLMELHAENSSFFRPKFRNTPVFGIQHFAGVVLYDTKDFIEKNHDSCSMDLKQVVQTSANDFLRRVFAKDLDAEATAYHRRRLETLASKFQNSLDQLMAELNECQPFFVRCIKPNELKRPQAFDRAVCHRQLQYSGMTAVTRVREAGHPVRFEFLQFVQQYRAVVPGLQLARKTDCKAATYRICQTVFENLRNPRYRLGRTKIFLKHDEALLLEAAKEKALYSYAVTIQKVIRGWLQRRRLQKLKRAVVMAENCWRERQRRIKSHKARHGFYRLQAKIKSREAVLQFVRHRRLLTRLQACCRGYLIRSAVKGKLKKAVRRKESSKAPTAAAEFKDFARKYFQGNQNHKFSKKPLKTSLTRLVRPEEEAAAKAIWRTILQYTKNVPEPKKAVGRTSGSGELREILQAMSETTGPPNADKLNALYDSWLRRRTTDIEKLHFVIGHGLKRPALRDEIYCHVCKVLTNNPSTKGTHRGWELLGCLLSCFPPSDLLLPYLKTTVRKKTTRYTSFCLFRLHRLIQNGCRTRPPHATELQAIRQQKPVHLEVLLANGGSTSAKIDSATTARELLDVVAKNIGLSEALGFSLVLRQEGRQVSLGEGSRFVLDAVSECEQYVAEVEGGSDSAPWKLYLRKEMFAPWHDSSADEVASELIYQQIRGGVVGGEYGFQDPELPTLLARVCYAEAGYVQPAVLKELIGEFSPRRMGKDDLGRLEKVVEEMYYSMYAKTEPTASAVRAQIIDHAVLKWTLQFSRFFSVIGSVRNTKGAQVCPEVPLAVGVNYSGIFITDESNEIRLIAKIDYPQIQETSCKPVAEGNGYVLKITTYDGLEVSLSFASTLDNDLHRLLYKILETLKKYSKFAISVKDYRIQDDSFLDLQKGDLITLTEGFSGQDVLHNSWGQGLNTRTGKTGSFLLDSVWIIPTVKRPPEPTVRAIRETLLHGKRPQLSQLIERHKHYTLESYAHEFFSVANSEKGGSRQTKVWRHSAAPIQQPLLARIATHLAGQAVSLFRDILHYTQSGQQQPEAEEKLIHKIFSPGLADDDLKDETYCQVMKQLTSNPEKESENRAWELLWLLTGLFACSGALGEEVKKFLQSRRTIHIARECLLRFYEVQRSPPRKATPHRIEVEAVRNRPCHVFHRVCFPDGTNKFFKVHSLTKFGELREAILSRLSLTAAAGFGVFVRQSERLFSAPDEYYLFDYLQSFRNWVEGNKTAKPKGEYKICFMRCTTKPPTTSDKVTVLKFIFPQEYNKYIQGYYNIPAEDVIQLAALLYKVCSSDEKAQQQFPKILQKLIPPKAMSLMKPEAWQSEIQASYKNHHLLSSAEECKTTFLRHLSKFSSNTLPYFALPPETSHLKNYMFYSITHRSG